MNGIIACKERWDCSLFRRLGTRHLGITKMDATYLDDFKEIELLFV